MKTRDLDRITKKIKRLEYIIFHIEKQGTFKETHLQIISETIPDKTKKVPPNMFSNWDIPLTKKVVLSALQEQISEMKEYIRENV